jgi:hypothetical protein
MIPIGGNMKIEKGLMKEIIRGMAGNRATSGPAQKYRDSNLC